jgi:hypothetical protein
MVYSGMLLLVALVRTDVSVELSASFVRVTRIGDQRTRIALTTDASCEEIPTSVLKRATRRNIPEDIILHSHRSENLKSYIALLLVFILTGRGHHDSKTW